MLSLLITGPNVKWHFPLVSPLIWTESLCAHHYFLLLESSKPFHHKNLNSPNTEGTNYHLSRIGSYSMSLSGDVSEMRRNPTVSNSPCCFQRSLMFSYMLEQMIHSVLERSWRGKRWAGWEAQGMKKGPGAWRETDTVLQSWVMNPEPPAPMQGCCLAPRHCICSLPGRRTQKHITNVSM